jgi:hypothetical protein
LTSPATRRAARGEPTVFGQQQQGLFHACVWRDPAPVPTAAALLWRRWSGDWLLGPMLIVLEAIIGGMEEIRLAAAAWPRAPEHGVPQRVA